MSSDEVLRVVADSGLLEPGGGVLVLLSGGRDSTCLLDVAVRICGADVVRALHVNYGLREDAGLDEQHCRELCGRLGVALEVRHAAKPEGGNLQAWAREVRYTAGLELAAAADLATGHTASDQVETILYRLASSPSRRALLGMAPCEGRLVRPLLAVTREQTAQYCRERGLGWREDPSNQALEFARARIRTNLVPALREVHPAAEQNVLALAALLRDEAAVLDGLLDEILGGRTEVELALVRDLAPALRRLLVQRLADLAAGGPAPGTARRADEICALRDRAALDLPHGVRAVVEGGLLRFEAQPPNHRQAQASP